jgi:hypothetical protein
MSSSWPAGVIDEPRRDPGARDADEDERARLRLVAIVVVLALIVVLAVADTFGRLLYRPDFHVGDAIFGALIGALLLLIGVEGISRFPWGGGR